MSSAQFMKQFGSANRKSPGKLSPEESTDIYKKEATAGSVVTTVETHKSKTYSFKWKDSQDIMNTGKEYLHFVKYDNFG